MGLEPGLHNNRVAFDYSAPSASSTRPAVLFCCGFRSSMSGNKALALKDYCSTNNIAYCRFDYRGHGESCGNFVDLTLSDWIQDTELILNTVLSSHNKVIVVGSSMGAWIALHLAIQHPDRVAGIVGLAAATDFLQDLFLSATPEQRSQWQLNETVHLPSQYDTEEYPVSWNLIRDAQEKWLLMDDDNAIIPVQCPVRFVHGQRDFDVPWQKSVRLLEMLATDDAVLTLVKSGDHRRWSKSNATI
jgi:pimeloyl-ACP methyl ester carboxylesterase